ncbi:phage capsid protein [Brucella sp. MAB-22]|uniref:phage capsid protein n=1 Tax=Brucella sp. MAB-22 TaxID=2986424 RepID=UPI00221EDE58|nr:phage capsid protein [Brucella sp. MAB-22]UYT57495.1 phage capsid protein [Brucella sp. MAB-22]
MQQAPAWFREVIKDKITILYQAMGGYLDGTMLSGDTQANTVKFPIVGRLEAKEITGSIQFVEAGNADMTTVQVTMKDFEAAAWIRSQDKYKMGPNEQDAVARLLTMAIKRRADKIKLGALDAFTPGTPDIGTGAELIDITFLEQGRSEIAAQGEIEEDQYFCPLPEMWMSQLLFYKEFSDAKYVGPENAPFSKSMRQKARTVRDVHYFTMPDEYFSGVDADSLDTWMWAKSAMGAETPWNKEQPSFTEHPDREGTPLLGKVGMGGAAIGIQRKGVKRLRFKKITTPERPAIKTIAA